jgi:hypothetical protein
MPLACMAVPVTTRLQPPKAAYLYIAALGRMSASNSLCASVLDAGTSC